MTAYFEEFGIGDTRKTGGRTITETDIIIHAGQTGDFFPHHMDEEWCKTQPFKKKDRAWHPYIQHRYRADGRPYQ